MFVGWPFLLGEIWTLLLLATILGGLIGWLFGRMRVGPMEDRERRAALQAEQANVVRLERERDGLRASLRSSQEELVVSRTNVATLRAEIRLAAKFDKTEGSDEPGSNDPPEIGEEDILVSAIEDAMSSATRNEARLKRAPDDLQRIRGIGPKLAEHLNDQGIRRFGQIATWTESDIDRIGKGLGKLGTRILRDGWVEQAKKLATENRPLLTNKVDDCD